MKSIWQKLGFAALVLSGLGLRGDGQTLQLDIGRFRYSATGTREIRKMPVPSMNTEFRKKALPAGVWGGPHISFDVSAQRTVVEYDCAHATIDQKIFLDARGRFSVSGTQFQERGGPVRRGAETGFAVRFTGKVKGKTLTLTVTNSETKEEIGTFTLVHGGRPRIFKCK